MQTQKKHPYSYYSGKRVKRTRYSQVSLIGIAEILSQELKSNGQERTGNAYITVSNGLTEFTGNKNLPLSDITPGMLRRYDDYLIKSGRKPNSVSFHMRNLRAIYNKAIQRGLIPLPSENLFVHVHTGVYETRKRALTKEEMHSLSELSHNKPQSKDTIAPSASPASPASPVSASPAPVANPPRDPLSIILYRTLLYFLFCFHARGMAFIDMAFLKKSDIYDDCIHYYRKKTRKQMSVKITFPMQKILDYFSPMVSDSPYLFPVIHPDRGRERKQYETALTLQNRRLKILSKMAGIAKILSTHVARHSWATIAKKKNVPLSLICDCLGHRDEKTTGIYLDSFETSVMDEVSELISRAIC